MPRVRPAIWVPISIGSVRRYSAWTVIIRSQSAGVDAVFHYVPLHSSPAGRRFGRASGDLPVTDDVSARLIRLPLWLGMTPEDIAMVVNALRESLRASTY